PQDTASSTDRSFGSSRRATKLPAIRRTGFPFGSYTTVTGWPINPMPFSIALVGSDTLGYVHPYFRTQALAAAASSWMSTPTNWTLPAYALASEASAGASSAHGPHHVAQ